MAHFGPQSSILMQTNGKSDQPLFFLPLYQIKIKMATHSSTSSSNHSFHFDWQILKLGSFKFILT